MNTFVKVLVVMAILTVVAGHGIRIKRQSGSEPTDSTVTRSTVTNSRVDKSTLTDSTIRDSTVLESTTTRTTLLNCRLTRCTVTNSHLVNRNCVDQTITNEHDWHWHLRHCEGSKLRVWNNDTQWFVFNLKNWSNIRMYL